MNVLHVIYSTWNHETETVTSITVMIRILMQSIPILSKNQKLKIISLLKVKIRNLFCTLRPCLKNLGKNRFLFKAGRSDIFSLTSYVGILFSF